MPQISIVSYLRYLQEVSRKILQRGGFENVLYRKARKQDPCYFDYDRPSVHRPAYLRNISVHLQEQPGKGLFLGIGLITGQVPSDGKKRNLSSPLFYCAVELEEDEAAPGKVDSSILWDTISLNYDLATLLLEHISNEEPEEICFAPFAAEHRISPERLRILSSLENELDRNAAKSDFQSQLLQGTKLRELMKLIRDNIPEFGSIEFSTQPYDHKMLQSYVNAKIPTFFNHRFFFIAAVPDQLSTSLALRELIHQTE